MSDQEKAVFFSFVLLVFFSIDLRQALKGRLSGSNSWNRLAEYLSGLGFKNPERTMLVVAGATLTIFCISFAIMRFGGEQ